MTKVKSIVVWLLLTIALELVVAYGFTFYDYGFQGSCGIVDSFGNCALSAPISGIVIYNLFLLGWPTIAAGVIAWLLIKVWREKMAR